MSESSKSFLALTADEIMTADVIRLPQEMPLREAAGLLLQRKISAAPVVDDQQRCVGLFSATDFLRLAVRPPDALQAALRPMPVSCSFQIKRHSQDGSELILCALPPGVCPVQVNQRKPDGTSVLVCNEPHCVFADWQLVEFERLPQDAVRQYMTPFPVTVSPTTPLASLTRLIIDRHVHHVVVVDGERRPIGIVSTTEILEALLAQAQM